MRSKRAVWGMLTLAVVIGAFVSVRGLKRAPRTPTIVPVERPERATASTPGIVAEPAPADAPNVGDAFHQLILRENWPAGTMSVTLPGGLPEVRRLLARLPPNAYRYEVRIPNGRLLMRDGSPSQGSTLPDHAGPVTLVLRKR